MLRTPAAPREILCQLLMASVIIPQLILSFLRKGKSPTEVKTSDVIRVRDLIQFLLLTMSKYRHVTKSAEIKLLPLKSAQVRRDLIVPFSLNFKG